MQKIDLTNINKLTPPFFVTAIRSDVIGLNENLELEIDDVRCIIAIVDNSIFIQNNPDIRTTILSAFRLAYKNEEKLCKS